MSFSMHINLIDILLAGIAIILIWDMLVSCFDDDHREIIKFQDDVYDELEIAKQEIKKRNILLQEFINECAIGDLNENSEGHWGDMIREAKELAGDPADT